MFKAFAHGKVILIGEHSVVYDKQAIVLPLINQTLSVQLTPSHTMSLTSDLYDGPIHQAPKTLAPIVKLIHDLQTELKAPPVHIIIEHTLPISAGFGSSAALAKALTEAFYHFNQQPLTATKWHTWIQQGEIYAHGNPSGIDTLATLNTQAFVYQKNQPIKRLAHQPKGYLVVVDTGLKPPTKTMVMTVKKALKHKKAQAALHDLSRFSNDAIDAFESGNITGLSDALNQAHQALNTLGVSSQRLNSARKEALKHGALAAKLSGGGGGGALIALCDSLKNAKAVKSALDGFGPTLEPIKLGGNTA